MVTRLIDELIDIFSDGIEDRLFVNELLKHEPFITQPDSVCLLENNERFRERDNECKLEQCKCLQRLSNALKEYHSCVLNINGSNEFDFRDRFNDVVILNDTNHLLYYHATQFEPIHNLLIHKTNCNNNKSCKLSNCCMRKRNHRNRFQITSHENLLSDFYHGYDINDIVTQQILDSIHCYYFHTFDIAYTLTQVEKQNIINHDAKQNDNHIDVDKTIQQMNNVIQSKRKSNGLDGLNNDKNKFMITTQQNKLDIYSYGYRYFYWFHYKNNHKLYDDAHKIANHPWINKWGGDPPIANAS
eukprot:234625_1